MNNVEQVIHQVEQALPILSTATKRRHQRQKLKSSRSTRPPISSSSSRRDNHRSTTTEDDATTILARNLLRSTQEEISNILSPIRDSLRNLDAEGLLGLRRCNGNGDGAILSPRHGICVEPIIHEIEPESDGMRYIAIKEVKQKYSMGIFIFPPNTTIPLHDHPGMVVISRILYGDLKVRSFDILEKGADGDGVSSFSTADTVSTEGEEEEIEGSSSRSQSQSRQQLSSQTSMTSVFSNLFNKVRSTITDTTQRNPPTHDYDDDDDDKMFPPGTIRAREHEMTTMTAPDITTLHPRQGNIHEFTSGEFGAAILDVLLPPYEEEEDRGCTFYRREEMEICDRGDGGDMLSNGRGDGVVSDSSLCWLVPISQPPDFSCVSGYYGRLGITDDEDDNFP